MLYEVETAMELMHTELYDIKEYIINGGDDENKLVIKYINAVVKLNNDLREAPSLNDAISEKEKEVSMTKLESLIYDISGYSKNELLKYTGRKREFVMPKQVHMTLLHVMYDYTLAKAGSIYSKDHATALHSCKTVRNLYLTNRSFFDKYKPVFEHCKIFSMDLFDDFIKGKKGGS